MAGPQALTKPGAGATPAATVDPLPRMNQPMTQNVHVRIHLEGQAYWATVDEYPGVFAAGDTLGELRESLEEGLSLVIEGAAPDQRPVHLSPLLADSADAVASAELTLL